MHIVKVTSENASKWAELCNELWPHHPADEMLRAFYDGEYEHEYLFQADDEFAAFISLSIRTEYVEGKSGTGPVGYLEGIYVRPAYRMKGIGKQMVDFAKGWAAGQGCSMFASDCHLSNDESRMFHNKAGFTEESVNVHFTMNLH